MTQQQRADVWQRKLQLTQQLSFVDDNQENKAARTKLKQQIEACNQELIANKSDEAYAPKDE